MTKYPSCTKCKAKHRCPVYKYRTGTNKCSYYRSPNYLGDFDSWYWNELETLASSLKEKEQEDE